MLRVPEVPQFPAERTYYTIRDPFKAVANSECRSVLCTTGVVPCGCRLLLQIPICKEASQPYSQSRC